MKKLLTLFALMACFLGVKADEVVDVEIDYTTVTSDSWNGGWRSDAAAERVSVVPGEGIYFLLFEAHHRMATGKKEKRTDISDVLNDFMEEMDTHHHTQTLHIGRVAIAVNHMALTDDKDIAWLDDLLLCIEFIDNFTLRTEADNDDIHLSRLCRHRCFIDMLRQKKVVIQKHGFTPFLRLFQVAFFQGRLFIYLFFFYHVFTFCVSPAFNLIVFCWPLYNKVRVPFFLALILQSRTFPSFHSKLTS